MHERKSGPFTMRIEISSPDLQISRYRSSLADKNKNKIGGKEVRSSFRSHCEKAEFIVERR